MKNNILRAISLIIAVIMTALSLFSCKKSEENVITVGTYEKITDFSPFTEGKSDTKYLKDLVFSRFISLSSTEEAAWGENENCAALSVDFYRSDFSFQKSDDGDFSALSVVLKNNMLFSDEAPLTVKDVLYTLYTLTEDGVGTLEYHTFPLVGLLDYSLGKSGTEEMISSAEKAVSSGFSNGELNDAQTEKLKNEIQKEGSEFANRIIEYVSANYLSDSAAASYIIEGVDAETVKSSPELLTAFAMKLWNWGTFVYEYKADPNGAFVGVGNEETGYTYKTTLKKALENELYVTYVRDDEGAWIRDGVSGNYYEDTEGTHSPRYSKVLSDKYTVISKTGLSGFRDTGGELYTLEAGSGPYSSDFYALMEKAYTKDGITDFNALEKTEAANVGDRFLNRALSAFAFDAADGDAPESISGIKTEEIELDGETYEQITLLFNGIFSEALKKCTFYIAKAGTETDFAKETSEQSANESTPSKKDAPKSEFPVGSGPYVIESCADGEIVLSENALFSALTKETSDKSIRKLIFRPLGDKSAHDAVNSGYADIILSGAKQADADLASDKFEKIFIPDYTVDTIVINPTYYLNLKTREALASVFDISGTLKEENTAQTDLPVPCFFGYTADSTRIFDETGNTALENLLASGYKRAENGALIDPKTSTVAEFVFTVPPEQENGKIYELFEKAAEILEKIGAKAEIKIDDDLAYNIYSQDGVAVYAHTVAVYDMSALYDRYALSSGSPFLDSCGMNSIYYGGQLSNYGTIVTDEGEINQSDSAVLLDGLLSISEKTLDNAEKRKALGEALDIINKLCFEIPVHQHGSYALVNKELVDLSSLTGSPSPSRSIITEAWNLRTKADAESSEQS